METGTASGLKRADINSKVVIQGQEVAGFIRYSAFSAIDSWLWMVTNCPAVRSLIP
ncbi:MAG: hypothetical protein IPI66_02145 [Chitinophagaceae bacterium]|nr:hypothetical protein [Chitinophagaceae bacterium]